MTDRAGLAAMIRGFDPAMADAVESGAATVEERDLPFNAAAAMVVLSEQRGERGAWFGLAGGQAVELSGHPEAFTALAQSNGARISDERTAAEFAVALIDTTRNFDQPEYRVESADQVRMRPPMIDEERDDKARFLAEHAEEIRPAAATARPQGGFDVTLYRVRSGQVERVTVEVGEDGSSAISAEALRPTPPLPFSL